MTNFDSNCPKCGSEKTRIVYDDLGECITCGNIFETVDLPPPPKQHKTKTRDKFEDGEQ